MCVCVCVYVACRCYQFTIIKPEHVKQTGSLLDVGLSHSLHCSSRSSLGSHDCSRKHGRNSAAKDAVQGVLMRQL